MDFSLFEQTYELLMKYCTVIFDKSNAHALDIREGHTQLTGTSINVFLIFNHFWDNVVLPLLRERADG